MTDETLFARAVAIPAPADRASFLGRECADNPAPRKEVEELLAAHAGAGVSMSPPTTKYKLGEEIGEGRWAACTWPSGPSR